MADKEEEWGWTEATMAAYRQGRAVSAIEQVSVGHKIFIEIGGETVAPGLKMRIIKALQECLEMDGADNVCLWIRQYGNSLHFGYYRKDCPWTLRARDFLNSHSEELKPYHFHWISGLLYCYRPEEIQDYIDKEVKPHRVKTSRA